MNWSLIDNGKIKRVSNNDLNASGYMHIFFFNKISLYIKLVISSKLYILNTFDNGQGYPLLPLNIFDVKKYGHIQVKITKKIF